MKSPSVLVIGGGLAGLAATVALAPRGFRVTLLESRPRLGGRASSFLDSVSGQLVDACQHVSMNCCTNFADFCKTIGVSHKLAPQPTLYFLTPDRRVSRFRADPWPAPFHLSRALAAAHYLTPSEKIRISYGLLRMLCEPADSDPPLLEWLLHHRQTPRTIERFWGVVLVSALNETPDRVGLRYARKVFVDGFLSHRDAFVLQMPTVPLGELYGDELSTWLGRHDVEVQRNTRVKKLLQDPTSAKQAIAGVLLRDGTTLTADYYILAVPFERVLDLLPNTLADDPYFVGPAHLAPSPITSVHLWYDRPITSLPHAVLVGCTGHWVFNRGEVAPGEHYLQVVISASRYSQELGHDEFGRQIIDEISRLFPTAANLTPKRSKVITERTATFAAIPGVDRFRPPQSSPVPNLVLAGDWTNTDWPATMEGAVRSGNLAAEVVMDRNGRPGQVVLPDLELAGWFARTTGRLTARRLQ